MTDQTSADETTRAGEEEITFHRVARSGQIPEGYVRRFYVGEHECAVARLNGNA